MSAPIGTRMDPSVPARIVYVRGPRDGHDDTLEVPGGVPTIVAVDEPVGYYVRDELLPDGRWRVTSRGSEVSAE